MPSKLNSEFNYRYQVLGSTPWEKIKILRGFLEGRVRAAALEECANLKYEAKILEIEYLKINYAPRYKQLNLQAEFVEATSHMEVVKEAYELNRKEIEIINKLIAECFVLAEPTRIPGYSDEEMFEANAANEFTVNTLRAMQSEIFALGHPLPATVCQVMSNHHTLAVAIKLGMIPPEVGRVLVTLPPVLSVEGDNELSSALDTAAILAVVH